MPKFIMSLSNKFPPGTVQDLPSDLVTPDTSFQQSSVPHIKKVNKVDDGVQTSAMVIKMAQAKSSFEATDGARL